MHCQKNIKTLIASLTFTMIWNITAVRFRLLTIARTFKSSRGEAKTSSCADHSASLRRTTRIARKTLPWRSTARNRNVLSTPRRCGRSGRAIKRENGSIGAPVVILIRVTLVDFTFTYQITRTNAFMLVRSWIFVYLRTTGYITEPSFALRAKNSVENNSLPSEKAARNRKRLHQVTTTQKTT